MSKFKNNTHILLNAADSDVPVCTGRRIKLTKTDREKYDRRHRRGYIWHKTEGVSPWKRAERLLADGVGRPFDDVFSEYCKQVPKYQQHIFLQNIDPSVELPIARRWSWNQYYVNSNGLIAKRKIGRKPWSKLKEVTFKSFDYKTEKRHKITGFKMVRPFGGFPMKALNDFYGKDKVKDKKHHELSQMFDDMYEEVVVSGWSKTFESSKDREYQKLMAERRDAIKKQNRQAEMENAERIYRFTHETPEQRAERIRANFFKILKHGFDPETSFRKDPEE